MTKLCVDCRNHTISDGNHMCLYPAIAINVVTGRSEPKLCDVARLSGGLCGPEGRFFAGIAPEPPPLPEAA